MPDLSSMKEGIPIYLDYNATTPCAPEVLAAMVPYFQKYFGNASSIHYFGRKAAAAVSDARSAVAGCIGCLEEELVFTSGATEANNIVLLSLANRTHKRRRVVCTAIEHKSVLSPCGWLADRGFELVVIPVTTSGVIDLTAAEELINDDTLLVSVQAANNEIGTIQPVKEIVSLARARGALVHSDATQAIGKIPLSVSELGVDFASFSAHKAYGPKGIGALFTRVKAPCGPVHLGGEQELGLRPGTLNVPAIVGFGVACQLASKSLREDSRRVLGLRESFESELLNSCMGAVVVGYNAERLPGTVSICFNGIQADAILANAASVCAGIGSACTMGAVEPSHVLLACGLAREAARSTIRFSLGRYTTKSEIEIATKKISESFDAIRTLSCSHT